MQFFLMIFTHQHHKNCKTLGAEIFQEYNFFLWSLKAHQLSLELEKVSLKIALFCDDLA
jgi:hypothetical protein